MHSNQILFLERRELLSLPEHLSSPPVFSGVRGTRSFDTRMLINTLVSSNSSSFQIEMTRGYQQIAITQGSSTLEVY